MDDRLADYRRLLFKATEKFDEIHARQKSRMACGSGCSDCCVAGLTVSNVELANVREFVAGANGLADELTSLERLDPHAGRKCALLTVQNTCSIYEARPLVCRTHGAPLFFKDGDASATDACPKNFDDEAGLGSLSSNDFINLDLLNNLLATVNVRFAGFDGATDRTPLTPAGILGRPKP